MGFEVSLNPSKIRIHSGGGKSKHTIINHCAKNLAYKIIFPPNSKYSVAPDKASGVIEVGRTVDIEIVRQAGKGPHEDMTIEYTTADPSDPSKAELTGKTVVKLIPDG
ncbi:unnamed protein product [Heligmosomoides polygyrus]|uniref:MSP domain-containing protein n=1 Tax=Heligmosomoides polygyrus TaxID=6339 RepID=A0A183G134_HELPZ|nr:unnamed protein product [Heligmosomoides polygyrus]